MDGECKQEGDNTQERVVARASRPSRKENVFFT